MKIEKMEVLGLRVNNLDKAIKLFSDIFEMLDETVAPNTRDIDQPQREKSQGPCDGNVSRCRRRAWNQTEEAHNQNKEKDS